MSRRVKSANELLVINSIHLVDYYNKMVVPLNSKFKPMSEERNTGLCMFHDDTDPSLHYWKRNNIFHCFGCGFGGDVVKTHINLRRVYYGERMSIESAIKHLATLFEITLNEESGYEVQSVFDRARSVLFESDTYTIPKGTVSIAEFRQLNNRVKRSRLPMDAKIANFEHLDTVASIALAEKK